MHFYYTFSVFILTISNCNSQSTSSSSPSVTSFTSTYANSSPTSSYSAGSTPSNSDSPSYSSTTDSVSIDGNAEKLVSYTTGQKTIFIACCGGTFVLLIALAILSGLSDTIARSKQKTKRTHA